MIVVVLCLSGIWFVVPRSVEKINWHKSLPHWMIAAIVFALISSGWNGLTGVDSTAMAVNAVISLCSVLFAFLLVGETPPAEIRGLLSRITLFLSAIGVLYSAESFLALGLRSELGQFYNTFGFGIDRVHGPLFASSRGQIILLPALAFALQEFLARRRRGWMLLQVLSLTVTLLGLGSRAAVLLLAAFIVAAAVLARRRIPAVAVLLSVSIIGGTLVFFQASPDRLLSLQDSRRLQTHLTAWDIVRTRDWSANLAGSGYGSIWHWYMEDALLGDLIARGIDLRQLDYGPVLFEPHSLPLILVVELGAFGTLVLLKFAKDLLALVVDGIRNSSDAVFTAGLAISAVSCLGETLIFKDAKVSAIWLIFLFAAMRLTWSRPPIPRTRLVACPAPRPMYARQAEGLL
jgi:hypothetical protein